MGLGILLPISAIVTTVLLVAFTETQPGVKVTAVAVCVASFIVPRVVPQLWWLAGVVQVTLSIVIILYLKLEGFLD